MISIPLETYTILVECQVQIHKFWLGCPGTGVPQSIVVQTVDADCNTHQFSDLSTALIRDSLLACGAEYCMRHAIGKWRGLGIKRRAWRMV